MLSCENCKNFNKSFFIEHLQWLLLEEAHTFIEIFVSTKDSHREKAPSNKTRTVVNIWVVGASNQLDMVKHELRVTSYELKV